MLYQSSRTRSVSTAIYSLSKGSAPGAHSCGKSKPWQWQDHGAHVSIWLKGRRRVLPFLLFSHQIVRSFSLLLELFLPKDTSSRVEMDFECTASERSSRDERSYNELLEVVSLHLDWPQEQVTPRRYKLDDRFLSGGQREASERRTLPFFQDIHDELPKSWNKTYSSRVFVHVTLVYSTIVCAKAQGYTMMPPVEEMPVGYLSPGSVSSLKKPVLPSRSCRITSFQVAGQAGAAVHTMLQTFQADLLKDMGTGGGNVSEEVFSELRQATDLSLPVTKQTAHAIGLPAYLATQSNAVVWEAFDKFIPLRAQGLGLSATQPQPDPISQK